VMTHDSDIASREWRIVECNCDAIIERCDGAIKGAMQ